MKKKNRKTRCNMVKHWIKVKREKRFSTFAKRQEEGHFEDAGPFSSRKYNVLLSQMKWPVMLGDFSMCFITLSYLKLYDIEL